MVKAPIGKRVIAYLIDVAIVMVLVMGLGVGGMLILSVLANMLGRAGGFLVFLSLPWILLTLLLGAVYTLIRDGMNKGASFGKKIMKLRVVKDGMPCTYKDSLIRNIILAVPVIGFIEMIMPFIDAQGLRFGDKIAKTQVVML